VNALNRVALAIILPCAMSHLITHAKELPSEGAKWIREDRIYQLISCGVLSLMTIATLYGKEVGIEDLYRSVNPDVQGSASFAQIGAAARSFKLIPYAVRYKTGFLPDYGIPFIAHLRNKHFVSVLLVSGDGVLIQDGLKMKTVPRKEFLETWTGNALFILKNKVGYFRLLFFVHSKKIFFILSALTISLFLLSCRRFRSWLKLSLLSLVIQCGAFVTSEAEAGSTLSFEESSYHYECVTSGRVSHTYHFRNTGDLPVTILNVRTTCSCIASELTVEGKRYDPGAPGLAVVLPGEKGTLSVSVTPKRTEKKFQHYVYVMSNDAQQNMQRLSISGSVRFAFDYSPRYLVFKRDWEGHLPLGTKVLTIWSQPDTPFLPERWEFSPQIKRYLRLSLNTDAENKNILWFQVQQIAEVQITSQGLLEVYPQDRRLSKIAVPITILPLQVISSFPSAIDFGFMNNPLVKEQKRPLHLYFRDPSMIEEVQIRIASPHFAYQVVGKDALKKEMQLVVILVGRGLLRGATRDRLVVQLKDESLLEVPLACSLCA
jgi:hypothetical protein